MKNIDFKKIVILVAILVCSIVGIVLLISLNTKVSISLNGDDEVEIPYGIEYEDEGFTLKKGKKVVSNKKYQVDINNNVDVNNLGEYEVTYDVKYKKKNYHLERKVVVSDTEAPVIYTNLDIVKRDYCTKNNLEEFTYHASDNYDGDLTDKLEIKENDDDNKFILSVTDSNGNSSSKEVIIDYQDKKEKYFRLNGDATVYVELGFNYNEQGAVLDDGCGNILDADIKVNGNVDINQEGEYEITYELDGNVLTRKVIVQKIYYSPKVIYLTFDDGPGYYTDSILNTLAKYNVKATFFVTNQFPNFQHLIGREHNEGHRVAVHTYSHNYNIYSSVDTYINDFNNMNEIIKSYTGSYSNLFRFPGGSSNTISRNYSYGVVSGIAAEMTRRGYVYFDWNVESGDAAGYSSEGIYYRVVNGVDSCDYCVVLMHDIKATTADALDSILYTLTRRGYTFATLDVNSPTAHHKIAN